MTTILYRKDDDGTVETGYFEPGDVYPCLQNGWSVTKDFEEAEPEIDYEAMTNAEIRALAKEANLENHDDARIATLIRKLRERDGESES